MANILLVEDERNLSNLVRRHLEDDGHRVDQVFDGTSALKTIEEESPDLVILDIMLPGVVVSRALSGRLKRLEETANSMAEGDLTLTVLDTSEDEIGQLGQAFNQMAEQLGDALQAVETEKEQVEALLKDRRELVANISHDLRTPIASVSAHLEALTDQPEHLDGYLPILNDEIARVSALLDDLFELSRLDTRELTLYVGPVDLGDLFKFAERNKPLAWDSRRIVLQVEVPEGLPPVKADIQRAEQILLNLLTNGLRFTSVGGVISMAAEQTYGQYVEVCVQDTGVGIPPEDLLYIFDRFYRGDPARMRTEADDGASTGSGLGLAIVKSLVEAMGGRVAAVRVPLGRGPVFVSGYWNSGQFPGRVAIVEHARRLTHNCCWERNLRSK